MMKKYIVLSTALLALSSTSIFADALQQATKDEVMKLIDGNTISTGPLATMGNKVILNTFTGYFNKDGSVKAKFKKPIKGQPQKDKGTWMVKDDGSFCINWTLWGKTPRCLSAYQLTNGYILVNQETKNFEAVILNDDVKAGDKLK